MPKGKPVVFGEKTRPKEQNMRLKDSKYLKAQKKSLQSENNWREITVSESILVNALNYALSMNMTKLLKRGEIVERVIVGEPANGVYPLSVAISKKGGIE